MGSGFCFYIQHKNLQYLMLSLMFQRQNQCDYWFEISFIEKNAQVINSLINLEFCKKDWKENPLIF